MTYIEFAKTLNDLCDRLSKIKDVEITIIQSATKKIKLDQRMAPMQQIVRCVIKSSWGEPVILNICLLGTTFYIDNKINRSIGIDHSDDFSARNLNISVDYIDMVVQMSKSIIDGSVAFVAHTKDNVCCLFQAYGYNEHAFEHVRDYYLGGWITDGEVKSLEVVADSTYVYQAKLHPKNALSEVSVSLLRITGVDTDLVIKDEVKSLSEILPANQTVKFRMDQL